MALGQLVLKGTLDEFLQTCGDGATQKSAEHGDIGRPMHSLRIDLHLDLASNPLQPDLAAVGGPLHPPDQGAEPARDLVDDGLQTCASLVERVPMLYGAIHQGHSLAPFYVMRVTFFSTCSPRRA